MIVGTWRERVRVARLRRRHRHYHPNWDQPGGAFTHSHLYESVAHEHELAQVCVDPDCDPFPLHRCHPRPVIQ